MQSTEHIVWNADRMAVDFGTIQLPFPISIWGLLAAVALFYLGFRKLVEKQEKRASGNKKEEFEPSGWKVLALAIGSLAIGQILFIILPSPTFESIGPIQIHWYGLLFISAFIAGFFIERKMYLDAGRTEEELEKLFTYVLIATIIGARLGHIIFYDLGYYLRNPAEIIAIWHGGLASHGAAIGILIAMYLYVKKMRGMSYLWLADRVVIVVALGGAFIRTGNFVNSEIVGMPSDLPWAIIFTRVDMLPRHPTMLYEALLCILTFSVLWMIYKKYKARPPDGSIFGIFLIILFGGRFLLEFTKMHQAEFATGWLINMGQILSIPLVAAGIWLLWKRVNWKDPAETGN